MANNSTPQAGIRSFATLLQDYEQRLSLRTPADMIILLTYCMPVYGAFRVCTEAGIFRTLGQASPESVTITDIVKNIPDIPVEGDAAEVAEREEYISRMLCGVCALNFVDEAGPSLYRANELTLTMAEPGFERGFNFCFDSTFGPRSSAFEMLNWSKKNGYRAPTVSTDGPYQQARGIVGTTSFQDWGRTGGILDLSIFMQRIQSDRLHWSEWFPSAALFGDNDDDGHVFMVDVGGGFGHDLSGMAGRHPEKKLQLILQDQAEVIQGAKEQNLDSRIEFMTHNFFDPQPVKGANIYFMHKIMHDWPEGDCIKILSHLRDAMAPHSRILINEAILPDRGSPLLFPAFDMMMFAMLSAKERSESMWKRLVAQVDGLQIRKLWQAPELRGEGIVEIERVGA